MPLRHIPAAAIGTLAAVAAALLAGCGSAGRAAAPAATPAGGATSASAPPSTAPPVFPVSPAVTIHATDSVGDKATLVIKVGQLSPVTDVTDSDIHACDDIYGNLQTTAAQSIAVPVQLSATVTSSEPAGMIIVLDGSDAVEPKSQAPAPGTVGPANVLPSWVLVYINDPQCTGVSMPQAEFQVNSMRPGVTVTWLSYLIVPAAVTPDDPDGIAQDAGLETIVPQLTLGEETADYTVDSSASSDIVQCVDTIGDANTMVSVDPPAAVADGCTR
jgi:hypothetical protein